MEDPPGDSPTHYPDLYSARDEDLSSEAPSVASSVSTEATTPRIDVEKFIKRLRTAKKFRQVTILRAEIEEILTIVKPILLERPMLLEVTVPVKVLGDIHGQYFDLLKVFDVVKYPSPANQMLFLGDYVDRGKFGLETICLLFALKIVHPDAIHLLRGNHESDAVTRVYGFYEECKRRQDEGIWRRFVDVFNCLPVAAIIGKKILCMHGGLSPFLKSLDDVRNMRRPIEVPPGGLLTDLLWADPDKRRKGWTENGRGVSFMFGPDVVHQFCQKLNIDMIIRAHQVVFHGYELFAGGKLMTIFTAPNFCGMFQNMGVVANVDAKLRITLILFDGIDKNKAKGKAPPQTPSVFNK